MRTLICFLLSSLVIFSANAQKEINEDSGWSLKDRGYVGLGIGGISFGSHQSYGSYFSAGAGLLGGYMLTRNLSAGAGVDYQFTTYSDQKMQTHAYGGYPFIRYNIKNFFIQFDYDFCFINYSEAQGTVKLQEERFFGGIGFFNGTKGRTFVNFLLSYDFLYTNSSMFGSPVTMRLFFTF